MSDIATLRQKIVTISNIGEEFMTNAQARSEGWQRNYIALRQTLHDTIAELGTAGRRVLSQRGDEAKLRAFENLHARFRRLLSLHQANWPVVRIDPENPDYLRSMKDVADAHLEFVEAVKEICASAAVRPVTR